VPAKRYRFTGKERDEESGLNYHGARYYAPWICRWTSPDPIGIKDGLNIYAYVNDNPVKSADLNGNWGTEMHFAAVYWAGRMQGATHTQALAAAIYSQSLDDFEETAAPTMKFEGTVKTFLAEVPSEGPDQLLRANNAHALGLTKQQSQKIANMGIAQHNMLFFGVGLHAAGDWLPHANLSALPSFGHQNNLNEDESPSFMWSTDADHPNQNPKKALATFNIFRDLWSGYLNKGTPAALNNDQLNKLNAFFAEAGKGNNWEKMVGKLQEGLLQTGVSQEEINSMYKYMGDKEARKELIRKVQSIEKKKLEYNLLWDEIRKIKPSNDQLFVLPDDAIKTQVEAELAKQPVAVPAQLPFVTPQQEKDPDFMIRRDIKSTVSAPNHPPYPVYQH
jgi:RHS repeat-associated protein